MTRTLLDRKPGESSEAKPPTQWLDRMRDKHITMAHGSGGKAMRELIERLFVEAFDNPLLAAMEDQAVVPLEGLRQQGTKLAFTTDSYVVNPLFFPGGSIGELAVHGTINDLAVSGATPLFLSCGMILEEGLSIDTLGQVVSRMREAAALAGVSIVTGDTKVVERGAADKLFVNTAGIGIIQRDVAISARRACPGDVVITNGNIGDHGVAILLARNELALESTVESDTQPLHDLVRLMLEVCPDIHCLRDATRGGVATVLNEFAAASQVAIHLVEAAIPVRESVRGACEILGLDPLYLANEGKLVAIVPREQADSIVDAMRTHPAGRDSAIIGEVKETPNGAVLMATAFGGLRVVDTLVGDQLPRIC
ncbi:hydrogenase maturation protein HypE [Nitrospira moscoviensis]|uniref:Hydrogenase maturation protein n=2 Tax=Nitrospira moscoviensis TaxID=42253 RepID=A0A088NNR9_NITMO|nr:hydrogenase expression/formation protein HypE [Nitrospira moscoviensis]AIN51371.1 hydrogenase maturation protein [Nitrospira moscoviensis]ALA58077.1 hydrogenase maturation protein HypE [Nitrospira moscoviensis]